MQIEIWSDVICPWCYIGKRRFEQALAAFAHKESVSVTWRSFELDPQAPPRYPETLEQMLARKYGVSQQEAAAMNARVTAVAKEIGLDYRLSAALPGNTFDAHRLLHFAAARGLGAAATERIMQGYFSAALAVGERAELARLAPSFGISQEDALVMLESDAYADAVRADEARAAQSGISGVPFFLFGGKVGVSGAQSVEVISQALQQAWDDR